MIVLWRITVQLTAFQWPGYAVWDGVILVRSNLSDIWPVYVTRKELARRVVRALSTFLEVTNN